MHPLSAVLCLFLFLFVVPCLHFWLLLVMFLSVPTASLSFPFLFPLKFACCPLDCSCLRIRIGITWSVGDVPRSSKGETWHTLMIVVGPTTFIGSLSLFSRLSSCLCSDSIICPNCLVLLVCLVLYLLVLHSFRFIVLFDRRSHCCVVVLSILSSDEHQHRLKLTLSRGL